MQLSIDHISTIQKRISINVIPEGDENLPQLENHFGAHTFFVSDGGLVIFEKEDGNDADGSAARLFIVAVWEDQEQPSRLLPQEPFVRTDVVVNLETGAIIDEAGSS